MKRLIAGALGVTAFAIAGQALAADLPAPAAPPPRAPATYVPTTAPVYNWSGFYLGINGGYGFGNSTWDATTAGGGGTTGSFKTDGFLVGGTLGANIQMSALVLGAEADLDWTDIKGNITAPATGGVGICSGVACQTANDWLGTARARIGVAFDRVLVYGTGGAAFGNIEAGLNPPTTYDSTTKVGWTAGAGVEFALTQNLTAKIEYLYVDLGSASCSTTGNCGPAQTYAAGVYTPAASGSGASVSFTESLVRAGVNYKF